MKLRGRNGRMILKGLKGQIPDSAVDGDLVVAVDWRGALAAWQLWSPTPLRTVANAHAGRANAVVLGPTWIATGGWDGAVRLWQRESFAPLVSPARFKGRIELPFYGA